MAPTTEPTNGEILTLLQQHMTASAAAAREQAAAAATLAGEVREVRESQRAQGVKILEMDRRLTKTEHDTRRLHDSHTDLEGSLLREVGALAANDKTQNRKLADIERETLAQSAVLAQVDGYWQSTKKYARFSFAALLVAPKAWEAAGWIWHLLQKVVA